nr:hypothetical protein [Oceanobacillus profundus]
MRAWLKLNEHAIAPESHEAVLAVLSRLKGAKAGPFAQTRITKGTAYTWATLVSDVEGLFRTTNQVDWARSQLRSLVQGKMSTDDYIVKYEALYQQAAIDESHAISILETNTRRSIIAQIFREDKRSPVLFTYLKEIRRVGAAQEALDFVMGSSFRKVASRDPDAMQIDAAQRGSSPKKMSCYNCGGDHGVKNCPKPRIQCPSCKWLGGKHKKECAGGRNVRVAEQPQEQPRREAPRGQDPFAAIRHMNYDEMRAYFWDMKDVHDKGKGRAA